MIPEMVKRLAAWKNNVENHTVGLVIALIQLERARRSQRSQDLLRQDLLRDVARRFSRAP